MRAYGDEANSGARRMTPKIAAVVIVILAFVSSARADVVAGAGAVVYRCLFAFGQVNGFTSRVEVCLEYGPNAEITSAGKTTESLTGITGFMMVRSSRAIDYRSFRIDPTNPSNPQPALLTALVLDPTLSIGMLTLKYQTITANLTFNAAVAPPDAGLFDFAGEGADGTPMICAEALAEVGASRNGAVTGTVVSSLPSVGGGTFKNGVGGVSQGVFVGGGAAINSGICMR